MSFDKKTLVLPKDTVFEEHTIVTEGDVIVGNHAQLSFGIDTKRRIFCGQGAEIEGSLRSDGDVRLDQSTHVEGDVGSDANVYIGERCFIKGDLVVEGDLDVGDDVRVGGKLTAKGWVQKRNPVPLVIYLFIYLLELLRMGQSAEVDRILKELEEADDIELAVEEGFLFVPDGSKLGLQQWDVKGNLDAGEDVRILGNLQIKGNARLQSGSRVLGALRADGDIELGADTEIQGEVRAGGTVTVGQDAQVLGALRAHSVVMLPGATVDGKIHAEEGVEFRTEAQVKAHKTAEGKVEEFQGKAADLVDLLS